MAYGAYFGHLILLYTEQGESQSILRPEISMFHVAFPRQYGYNYKDKNRVTGKKDDENDMQLNEFKANEGKQVEITVAGRTFARHAVPTHFVQVGESYVELIEKYIKPIYEEGDILSSSEKIISLCQKRVVYKKDMKLSWLAKFLSRFASHSSAGIGVDSPWKMQFAINQRGALYVIWAAVCAGFGKLMGKRGVFYEMVGQEVAGLDGFYDHCFDVYGEFGIRIPENSSAVCEEIWEKLGIKMMIVDANDLAQELLGKCAALDESETTLMGMIADNPCGNGTQLTPFTLIREVK